MDGELKKRLKKLRETGVFDRVEKLVFYNPDSDRIDPNSRYVAGVAAEYSLVVVRPRSVKMYTSGMIRPLIEGSWADVEVVDSFLDTMRSAFSGNVGVSGRMSEALVERFGEDVSVVSSELSEARAVKTGREIRLLEKAANETREVVDSIDPSGKTEREVAAEIAAEIIRRGHRQSFEPVVASGVSTASPHHRHSARAIKDSLYIDAGVSYKGYHSDLTLPFPLSSSYERHVERVTSVLDELEEFIEPGVTGGELHGKAVELLGDRAENFIHSLGHGIGLETHEGPRLSPGSEDVLEEGMTIAVEPAYYLKTVGVRVEKDYVVTANGARCL